jgi:hypothetical protein
MFCAPRLIFGGAEGVYSRFDVFLARTHFRRYRGCRGPFSYFTSPDSFSTVPRASALVLIFCAPRLFSVVPRASGPGFMCCVPGLIFGGTKGVGSRFHAFCVRLIFDGTEGVDHRFGVLRARTRFRRYLGRRLLFSYFALSNTFSAVPRASATVF